MLCLRDIEEEERISVKQSKSKKAGYTGLSILHRLHALYNFEYDRDLVYDELHAFSLNIVKNHIQFLKEDENAVNWQEADRRLDKFPWTKEYKASRTPHGLSNRLGFWKGEEYCKFAFPASEIVFYGLLTRKQDEMWFCLVRMAEFLQNHARNGWLEEDADTFRSMALRYAILLEEYYGPTSCHITLHNLLHLGEDISRFSGLDNYSCWVQERAVQRYVNQSSNNKNIEVTFASAEVRREVAKIRNECSSSQLLQDKADLNKLWAKSLDQAQLLYKSLDQNTKQKVTGLMVGGKRKYHLTDYACQQTAGICNTSQSNISRNGFSCRSVWKPLHQYQGTLYRENEFVTAIKANGDGEIIGKIQKLFTVSVKQACKTFVQVQVYDYVKDVAGPRVVNISDQSEVVPLSNISRKVMLYPSEVIEGFNQNNFIVVDFMRRIFPILEELVVVPYYPVLNDMVEFQGDGEEVWKARVVDFSLQHKTIKGIFFIHRHHDQWVPEASQAQHIDFQSILGISNGEWITRYSCWKDIPL